ncbi:MAG: FAD-dependent oxidoreductase [Bryobacteraceae bacterium]
MTRFALSAMCAFLWPAVAFAQQRTDVIVVSASSAGMGAAIAAGRAGVRVALIEETPVLGGLLANGLSNTDLRSPGGSSGVFEEFRLRSKKYYHEHFPDDPSFQLIPFAREGFRYEPHVADEIFKQMAAEIPSMHVYYRRVVTRVLERGNRVTGVVTEDADGKNPITFLAPVTIDATQEGDLLPLAGAQFRLGREARSQEEPHAGNIYMTLQGEIFGSGAGDDKIQAYALLITIKDYGPGADKTIAKPPHYDPKNYAPEQPKTTFWYRGGMLPNHKAEVNEMLDGSDAVDLADLNRDYINGNRASRHRVWEKYRDYSLGYLYFRQTVMGEKNLGLPDDEFTDNGNVPYILYVREGRRLEGVYMFNERDAIRIPGSARPPLQKDSIAVGDWSIDSHPVSRDTEGYIYLSGSADRYKIGAPYQAPYGVMVPNKVDGLLVPMAVSATHVGFQVLRLEPIRVSMGQAAGDAAALCVKRGIQPRHVPVAELQRMLLDQGNALYYYTDVPPARADFKAIQRLSQAGAVHGYDDAGFRPDKPATNGDVAKVIFRGLNLKVKMDYSDLWKVMRWHHGSQFSTPYHWATYYLMTLYNMGAFNGDTLRTLDPDAPATRAELAAWSAAAQGRHAPAAISNGDAPVTRGELCVYIDRLR